jgi:hypothetical protein
VLSLLLTKPKIVAELAEAMTEGNMSISIAACSYNKLPAIGLCLNLFFSLVSGPCAAQAPDPYASSNGGIPDPSEYQGPLFSLSHDYPSQVDAASRFPWQDAIGGRQITTTNAGTYTNALKVFVSADMAQLLTQYPSWNAAERGWFNEPWLGGIRESIHGLYVGSEVFTPDLFPGTGLAKQFTTYVLTYYGRKAANTLFKVWGSTATSPNLKADSTQFAEGSVIVKLAFSTANADAWPVMTGALQWPAFINTNATSGDHSLPRVDMLSFFQFDIIVKDLASAPKTGWVFTTLVYDKDAPGNSPWDKMVPLGAMWGNDPDINFELNPNAALQESWINPAAPSYSKATLGWGGRLAGPNDGAVNGAAFMDGGQIKKVAMLPSSSCMSCHGVSEWEMASFLLPSTKMPPTIIDHEDILMPAPGSVDWRRWFQSRSGTEAQDRQKVAFDYDLVLVFKSLPLWQQATGQQPRTVLLSRTGKPIELFQYNGLPFSGGPNSPAGVRR